MDQTLFLGVPFHAGQGHQGTALAPAAFRESLPVAWQDLGDVAAPEFHGREAAIHHAQALSKKITSLNLRKKFLCLVGGDHGQGLGTVHGMLHHHPDLIVVWIDAHADANVPSASPTGNMHGMPLAWLLGAKEGAPWWLQRTLSPKRLLYIGTRSIDPYERMLIEELDIAVITPEEARSPQFESILRRELRRMDPKGKSPVHISFDVDALDSGLINSTGTRVENGMSFQEVEKAFEVIAQEQHVVSAEVVEINPELGTPEETHKLCLWARDIVLSLIPSQRPSFTFPALRNAFSEEWRRSL
jgi:arginase